jgi:hypothetical protein
VSGTAYAVNARWSNSTTDGSWSNAANWSGPAALPLAGDNITFDWFTGYPLPQKLVNIDVAPLGDGSTFGKFEVKYYGGKIIDMNGHWLAFTSGLTIYRVQNGPTNLYDWKSTGGTGTINVTGGTVNAAHQMNFAGGLGKYTFGLNMDVNCVGARTGSGSVAGNAGLGWILLTDNGDLNVDGNFDVGSLGEPLFTGLLEAKDTSVLTVTGTMNLGDDGVGDGNANFGELRLVGGGVTTSIGAGNFENGLLTYVLTSPPSTLNITGNLDIGTVELDIDITGAAPSVGTTYTLVSVGGTMTGAFTLAAEDVGVWDLTHTYGGSGSVTAEYVVPEPMTMLILGGGLLALIRRR